jgi:4-hydroxyproline epimerase
MSQRIQVIDSHTGGEPTRLVIGGFPELGGGSLAERRERFRLDFDRYRSAIVNEPRGSDVIVGALLCEPVDPACAAGVIFFNNVGYLGMCGHGTIGLVVTLAYMGKIGPGEHRIETPVGEITALLHEHGAVTITNVPSYRLAKDVRVKLAEGAVTGDVAWGGNWFFLVKEHGLALEMSNLEQLTDFAWRIRQALPQQGITGADGAEIDHIELFAPTPNADSRNFVLCPGREYDRSPCGTGTSAKLACLYEDGLLQAGQTWRQESIVGSVFAGAVDINPEGQIIPRITGTAHISAETTLILDETDLFCWGLGAGG